MKKLFLTAVLGATLLWGCANQETLETVADVWDVPAMAAPRQISVELPEGAGAETLESDAGRLYVTDDYSLSLETLEAGDLDATLRQLTGRGKEDLTVMETQQGDAKRYEFVWAAAGETGEMLGRGANWTTETTTIVCPCSARRRKFPRFCGIRFLSPFP